MKLVCLPCAMAFIIPKIAKSLHPSGGFLNSETVVPHRVRAFKFTPLNANMEEIISEKEAKKRKALLRRKTIDEEEDEVAASRPKGGWGSIKGSVSMGQMSGHMMGGMSSLHSRLSMIDQPDTAVKMPMKKDVVVVQVNSLQFHPIPLQLRSANI